MSSTSRSTRTKPASVPSAVQPANSTQTTATSLVSSEASSVISATPPLDSSKTAPHSLVQPVSIEGVMEPVKGPRAPTVFGVEARELMLLMKSGEQAWLLAGTEGNHEFARVFFMVKRGGTKPEYIVRDNGSRVGPSFLEHLALDGNGATLSWSCGRKSQIPKDWYQVTYR